MSTPKKKTSFDSQKELVDLLVKNKAMNRDQAIVHVRNLTPKERTTLRSHIEDLEVQDMFQRLNQENPHPLVQPSLSEAKTDSIPVVDDSARVLFSFTIVQSDLNRVRALAKANGETVAAVLRSAVRNYLREHSP
jgi:hypothetical protein